MKETKKIAEGKHYTAVDIGDPADIGQYSLIHAKSGQEIRGKLFLKGATGATGTEISVTAIPPGSELGYFHRHGRVEETYILLKGSGYCQVDGECFPVKAGSVVRVAPEGIRGLCNTSAEEMVYICIQSRENSLEEHTYDDGTRVACKPVWEKR